MRLEMKSKSIQLAQIGCGYWGPNLLRAFSSQPACRIKYVVETNPERRKFVRMNFPRTAVLSTCRPVLEDPDLSAVVIATPARSHFMLAKRFLLARKHILVEKPLATKVCEVDELASIAEEHGLVVMAGHTFLFNGAVRYIQKLIDSGELGDLRYIYCQRLNLGRIRTDIDALWNFAPHDISILQYWLGNPEPLFVAKCGLDFVQDGVEDVVFLNIIYPKKIMASVHVSWLDPQKVRRIVVIGTRKMVIYDDLAEGKVAIYDKGIDRRAVLGQNMDFDRPAPPQFSYRNGDVLFPQIQFIEPLVAEASHFLDSIQNQRAPITGIGHARKVVSILERAHTIAGNSPSPVMK